MLGPFDLWNFQKRRERFQLPDASEGNKHLAQFEAKELVTLGRDGAETFNQLTARGRFQRRARKQNRCAAGTLDDAAFTAVQPNRIAGFTFDKSAREVAASARRTLGEFQLTVQRIGFRQQTVTLRFPADPSRLTLEVNFRLEEEALQLDEVIVTGTPSGARSRRATAATTSTRRT